jgi:hypothetical protein
MKPSEFLRPEGLPQAIKRRALRALANEGITPLGQLTRLSESELLCLDGIGPTSLKILRETLARYGQSLAPSISARPLPARRSG